MPSNIDSPQSSDKCYWSASDHSASTASFQSWSRDKQQSEPEELSLLTSETLSLSDDDNVSVATPTFSEPPQAAVSIGSLELMPQPSATDDEEIAKQLDFGLGAAMATLSSQHDLDQQAEAAAAFDTDAGKHAAQIASNLAVRDQAAASTVDLAEWGSESSCSDLAFSVAVSARPSCRRKAALDSDSEDDQVIGQDQQNTSHLLTPVLSSSGCDFDASESPQASHADVDQAEPSMLCDGSPKGLVRQQKQDNSNVIVLDSSDDEEMVTSCRRRRHLLCRDSDEEADTACKENLSPDQLTSRLHAMTIAPRTFAKPGRPPGTAVHPKMPQSVPWDAKRTALVSSSPAGKTQSLAAFKRQRESLAYQMFSELNAAVFGGRLPADLQIGWNAHLKTTAGLTHYSRITTSRGSPRYKARVELSTKVLDNSDKLQRTLCHELCHVATWLLDHVAKPPHGAHFKAWAAAAMKVHPHLDITTCHQYDIHYAWRWQCLNPECLQMYKRHSNSVDTAKQVCSLCNGQIQALGRFNSDGTPAKARAPSQYSLFVKDNFASQKKSCRPGTPHKDIMKALATTWRAQSTTSRGITGCDS